MIKRQKYYIATIALCLLLLFYSYVLHGYEFMSVKPVLVMFLFSFFSILVHACSILFMYKKLLKLASLIASSTVLIYVYDIIWVIKLDKIVSPESFNWKIIVAIFVTVLLSLSLVLVIYLNAKKWRKELVEGVSLRKFNAVQLGLVTIHAICLISFNSIGVLWLIPTILTK